MTYDSVTAETYTYITSETSPISMKCIDARVYLLYPVSPICPAKFPNMLQNGCLSGAHQFAKVLTVLLNLHIHYLNFKQTFVLIAEKKQDKVQIV